MAQSSTQAATAADPPKPPPKPLPIARQRFAKMDQVRMEWSLTVPDRSYYGRLISGDVEDLALMSMDLKSGDLLHVTDDASTFYAIVYMRLVIPGVAGGGLAVADPFELLFKEIRSEGASALPVGSWCVVFRGDHLKWCVVRPDGSVHRDRIISKGEADGECARQGAARAGGARVYG